MVTTSTSELRQREVGRREPDEGEAGHEPGAAEQHQRGEAVVLRLPGGADGAGGADDPEQREHRVEPAVAQAAPSSQRGAAQRQAAAAQRDQHEQRSCGCSRRCRAARTSAPRQRHETVTSDALEDALALEARAAAAAASRRAATAAGEQQVERDAAGQRDQLISSGALKPCQTARLYSGGAARRAPAPPRRAQEAARPSRPGRCRPPGRPAPAARPASASSAAARAAARGRSAGGGPKKTSWMKRSE